MPVRSIGRVYACMFVHYHGETDSRHTWLSKNFAPRISCAPISCTFLNFWRLCYRLCSTSQIKCQMHPCSLRTRSARSPKSSRSGQPWVCGSTLLGYSVLPQAHRCSALAHMRRTLSIHLLVTTMVSRKMIFSFLSHTACHTHSRGLAHKMLPTC